MTSNGGVQYVPQIAVQYVYLDFDGELTDYNGEILTIEGVEVRDPQLTQARIADILAELNKKYASQNVIFVTERPANAEYSTIFIGKTKAFDQYGSFAGLAETVDFNNQNHSDNAFVNLDSTATNEQIISTISHETDHLLGTLDHGGEGLQRYGYYYVYNGQTLSGITLENGDSMYIYSGGTATAIRENGGYVYVEDGANVTFVSNTISGLTLGDRMTVHQNTVANDTTLNYGSMYISSGGVANSTTVNFGGGMYISSGGVANSTTVNSGGDMYISSGGVANSTTVTYGWMYISSGGVANSTTVNTYSVMYIESGGVANSTTVNFRGSMYISSGGVANSMTVNSGGEMYISSGVVVNSTTVNFRGSMYISSGGTATAIRENGGYVYVEDGANVTFVSNTISGLTLSFTSMTVHENTVANSTTVNSGGRMYIESGGIHRGTLQINSGAWIYAYSGSTIDFSLTGRSASSGYLINDLSRIFYSPTFTITVSDSQESGTYKLAQGASSFTGSITIGTDTLDYGTLAVNGSAVENDTLSYRLVKTDGNLNLVVEDKPAALPDLRMAEYDVSSNSITTQESVKLTFKVYNDGDADTPASTIKVYDGDKLLREVALGEIAAGSYRNCYITLTAGKLSVGTHKVNVVLDSGNIIAESREDNNNSYRTIFVKAPAAQADLRMAEYDVSSNSITTQESVKLTFKVYNDGNADAPASTIKVYDGDRLLREVALGEIAAGGSRSCYITLTAGKLSVGTHKVNVVLDSGNAIAESREDNNNSYRTIFVKAATAQPDLRMAEYNVSSNNISTEESVKLTFKVYNDGDVKAAASTIKVYDGDKLLREVALGEIDAKGYRNCTITLTSGKLSVGTHKVNVVLDSGNLIAESNENNNNSYRTIFVKEPVRSLAAAPKENNSWDVCGTGSVDALCGENYADLNEWSLENSAALTRSAADILTTDKEESRLLNSGKLAG